MNGGSKQILNGGLSNTGKGRWLGLYVHWPYCVAKCPYCDFNSHVERVFDERQFVHAICREIDYLIEKTDGTEKPRLGSIFFGGGTPSLMQPQAVADILAHVHRRFALSEKIEITLEANPSSVENARLEALAVAGVNRVSLGVQALDEDALRVLGRVHGVSEALAAITLAQDHFARMSFDLIYGRHGQSLADWREELARAIDLAGGHLSLYQLTVEKGTRYQNLYDRGQLDLPANDRAARFFEETRDICARAGLPAYEISNYAAPGEASVHNLVYWRYGDYMGVGPGAHGRLVMAGQRFATSTVRSPKRWIRQVEEQGHGLESMEALDLEQQADEILLMGLRLTQGVDLARLFELTGYRIAPQKIEELVRAGLCRIDDDGARLASTDRGVAVLNLIVEQLSLSLVRD